MSLIEKTNYYYRVPHCMDETPPSLIAVDKDGRIASATRCGHELVRLLRRRLARYEDEVVPLANEILTLMEDCYTVCLPVKPKTIEMRNRD